MNPKDSPAKENIFENSILNSPPSNPENNKENISRIIKLNKDLSTEELRQKYKNLVYVFFFLGKILEIVLIM